MAGRIREEDIALVRERAAIDDVVREYVTLRNAGGGSMKGLCPFHDEKTPSFQVRPQLGRWHCFGCGEGGDVIEFVMKVDHLSFTEAMERLAGRAGITLRYEDGGPTAQDVGRTKRLYEAHVAAAAFFAEALSSPEAQVGRAFLAERGFDREAAERFGVGYSPRGWDVLAKHLRGLGYSEAELITSGLASAGQRGPIDAFRGRLVWPIRDAAGRVVGFGARRLTDDDNGPKYLNTRETPIFKKSSVLYGIDLARKAIAEERRAVVVEGYTDVMACHLAGVGSAVATCGTAFGEEHIKALRRYLVDDNVFVGEVVFTFDGDSAGQKAALKAFQDDQRFVTQTFVAVQPDGLDPCDLRRERGDAAVRDLVDNREPLFQFALRTAIARFDLDTAEGRVLALRESAPVVASIRDRSLRPEYARRLAGWLGMEVEAVVDAVRRVERAGPRTGGTPATPSRPAEAAPGQQGSAAPALRRPDPRDPAVWVEREALKLAFQAPAAARESGFDDVAVTEFTAPAYAAIRSAIEAAGGTVAAEGLSSWVAQVLGHGLPEPLPGIVTELSVEPLRVDGAPDARYGIGLVSLLRRRAVDREVDDLRSRLQRVDPADEEAHTSLLGRLVELEQRRRALAELAVGT